jgi:hypothetical protein
VPTSTPATRVCQTAAAARRASINVFLGDTANLDRTPQLRIAAGPNVADSKRITNRTTFRTTQPSGVSKHQN